MYLTTFPTKETVAFALMTAAERNEQIANRLMDMETLLPTKEGSISDSSKYDKLCSEILTINLISMEVQKLSK
jgi:hypothetical protein